MNYTLTTSSGTTYTVRDGLLWRNGRMVGTLYTSVFYDADDLRPLQEGGGFTVQTLLDTVPRTEGPAVGQHAYFSCREEWWWTTKIASVTHEGGAE
jgi:hypothetical protein